MSESTIASRYEVDAAAREPILQIARTCSRLTIPTILPFLNQQPTERLAENFQDTGASGVESLAGQMLLGLFPPDLPFVVIEPAAEIMHNPNIPDEQKRQWVATLQVFEIIFMASLESGRAHDTRRGLRTNFRSSKRSTLESLLVTGDTLERMTPDFRFIRFRRDKYTTKRNSAGDVLYHTIKENLDGLSLDDAERVLGLAGLPYAEMKAKPVHERLVDLYTYVEWQPWTKTWVTRQELKGKEINESEEPVSCWISTPYELPDGEDYGRGFIERRLGSLLSLDTLSGKMLDWAALASFMLLCIDPGSEFREKDLKKKSGSTSRGFRVSDGKIQDGAFLRTDKLPDFSIIKDVIASLKADLNKSMLNELDMQPNKDRVTATQIDRIRDRVMGATSGVYANISDFQQLPMVDYGLWQLAKQNKLPKLPAGSVEVRTLTGLTALGRQARGGNIERFVAKVGQLLPSMIDRLDENTILETIARYDNVNEPGIIKTRERYAEDVREKMRQQVALAAAGKTIDTTGNVIENAAAAAPQRAAA